VKDVAAPLYLIFLADAHAAARAGEPERVLECIGLALDFVPETQRERVLLAAADLVPAVGTAAPHRSAGTATVPPFVLRVSQEARAPREPRIKWEPRPPEPVRPTGPGASFVPLDGTLQRKRSGLRRVAAVAVLLVVVGLALAARVRNDVPGDRILAIMGRDPIAGAREAIRRGDAEEALRLVAPRGDDASTEVWFLRASAYEVQADRANALHALTVAAARDGGDGRWAMAAGDRLVKMGAVSEAADAYLYAVTPSRSAAEIERIARVQELAGHSDRARRVRGR
jgi:hypothetical protein